MRRTRLALVLLVLLTACSSSKGGGPLEDVTLRGRILRPDNTPLARTAIYAESVKPSGFLSGARTTRFDARTDAQGRYRFVFKKAHKRGEQTNTDYFVHVALGKIAASYELELQDAVHDAPDLVLWDPEFSVTPSGEDYAVALTERTGLRTSVSAEVGDAVIGSYDYGTIAGRDIEDAAVLLVPHASYTAGSGGTVYHQRFTGASMPFRGTHVPISRRTPCTVTWKDDSTHSCRGLTDGELTKQVLSKKCCSGIVIDLGSVRTMDDIDAEGCTCSIEVSVDQTTWLDFRFSTPPKPPGRFVRVAGFGVDQLKEVSVWPA